MGIGTEVATEEIATLSGFVWRHEDSECFSGSMFPMVAVGVGGLKETVSA